MAKNIMGCTLDALAFPSAAAAVTHFNGKKHRFKMPRFLKDPQNENKGVVIKDSSAVPVISLLNYFATLGSIVAVDLRYSVGIKESHFQSVVIFYDSEHSADRVCRKRHAVDTIPVDVCKYRINESHEQSQTSNPSTYCVVKLDDELVDQEMKRFYKEKLDLDEQMEKISALVQLHPQELKLRKEICDQIKASFRISINPHCEVAPFGSSVSGLGFRGCGLDIYMFVRYLFPEKLNDETYESWRDRCQAREKSFILTAAKLLQDSMKDSFEQVTLSLTSSSGLVKFVHKRTAIQCFLSFKVRTRL